jgi:DNA-binding transcriptional ArsR family regulator
MVNGKSNIVKTYRAIKLWNDISEPEDIGINLSDLTQFLNTTTSAITVHINKLKKNNLIKKTKQGKHTYYKLNISDKQRDIEYVPNENYDDKLMRIIGTEPGIRYDNLLFEYTYQKGSPKDVIEHLDHLVNQNYVTKVTNKNDPKACHCFPSPACVGKFQNWVYFNE